MVFKFSKSLTIVLIIMISFIYAEGQVCNITLRGKVSDHHENHALEFATIFMQENQQGKVTDQDGFFEFKEICGTKFGLIN